MTKLDHLAAFGAVDELVAPSAEDAAEEGFGCVAALPILHYSKIFNR